MEYEPIIPNTGNYYLFAHSLTASTTFQAEIADHIGAVTNMSLDQVEKSDTDWEWSVSEGIFLKAASYTFGLHNSGPSSAELDMYGLMMPNSSESEIISSASFVGRRIICPQNP